MWLVFEVGCIECGADSGAVGLYDTEEEANVVTATLNTKLHWRCGGDNYFEAYDLSKPQAEVYANALVKAKGEEKV